MSPFRLAVLGLIRRPVATLVAIVCVAVAVASAGVVISTVERNVTYLESIESSFDVIIAPKSNGLSTVLEALELIAPNEDTIPIAMIEATADLAPTTQIVSLHVFARFQGHYVVATDASYLDRAEGERPEIVEGQWTRGASEVVVGVQAARTLGLSVGDAFEIQASPSREFVRQAQVRRPEIDVERFFDPADEPFGEGMERPLIRRVVTVTGIIDHGGTAMDRAIFAHRNLGDHYHYSAFAHDVVRRVSDEGPTTFILLSYAENATEDQRLNVRRRVHRNSTVQFVDVPAELQTLRGYAASARDWMTGLIGIVIIMAALGIAVLVNARYDNLRPRLGLLRALGYGRATVAGWILIEALLVAIAAVALAILLELICIHALQIPTWIGIEHAPVVWPTSLNVAAWGTALVSAVASGAVPIIRLYSTSTQDALQGM